VQIAVALALLAGSLVARIDIVFRRHAFERSRTRLPAFIALTAILALIALVVWGFFHVTWYRWLAAVFILVITGGLFAGGGGGLTSLWMRFAPVLECFVIATAIIAWAYAG
jgi:hypothetical protein